MDHGLHDEDGGFFAAVGCFHHALQLLEQTLRENSAGCFSMNDL
jgi:hypothetical protein